MVAGPLTARRALLVPECRRWAQANAVLGPCFKKFLRIRELPHIGAARKSASHYRQAQRDVEGMQMRAWMVGIAVVVAIGLIWSVAVMSNLVPMDGSGMSLAGISRPAGYSPLCRDDQERAEGPKDPNTPLDARPRTRLLGDQFVGS